jgi:hypothetical protein
MMLSLHGHNPDKNPVPSFIHTGRHFNAKAGETCYAHANRIGCQRRRRPVARGYYTGLVTARNGYKNAFAQIDVQLQRRYDLIPNLVETAKGCIKHERETLEAVVTARGAAMNGLAVAKANPDDPSAMQALSGAETQLSQALPARLPPMAWSMSTKPNCCARSAPRCIAPCRRNSNKARERGGGGWEKAACYSRRSTRE